MTNSLHKSNIDYLAASAAAINRPGYVLNIVTGCRHGFEPTFHPERVTAIGGKPKLIFLNDMGDVGGDWDWKFADDSLHSWGPGSIASITVEFARLNPQHILLLLTKRPEWYALAQWPENVWCGFSATNNEELWTRFGELPTGINIWISLEPWLSEEAPAVKEAGKIWLAIGGLSGRNPQPMSDATTKWLLDKDIKARRFTKTNAISGAISLPYGLFPREYPDAWNLLNQGDPK